MQKKIIQTLGVASCNGGPSRSCGNGPLVLQASSAAKTFSATNESFSLNWHEPLIVAGTDKNFLSTYKKINFFISQFVRQQIEDEYPFLILSGDHSSASGTWSGVLNGLPESATFALIWIDAHMDAHTLESSPSGNLHGMPVSTLLGEAEHELQTCCPAKRYISGKDLYMLGIRSYEADELVLLSKHKVNVFDSSRIDNEGGVEKVLSELIKTISRCYDYFAITLDLDAIDPRDAPGVETPEKGGFIAKELLAALAKTSFGDNFLGLEITEFDPEKDEDNKTEKLVFDIVGSVYGDKRCI